MHTRVDAKLLLEDMPALAMLRALGIRGEQRRNNTHAEVQGEAVDQLDHFLRPLTLRIQHPTQPVPVCLAYMPGTHMRMYVIQSGDVSLMQPSYSKQT